MRYNALLTKEYYAVVGLIIVLIIVLVYFIFAYNRFIRLENLVIEGWSGVDVQLKRRYDLIPNLVSIVKAYTTHENQTLRQIVEARTQAQMSGSQNKALKENALVDGLKTLLAIAEDYPELKADSQFLTLHHTLVDIEDTLQKARRYYNATVRDYNSAVKMFPSNIIAKIMALKTKEYFEINPLETNNIKIEL
ncbi:MAG: LemA family protein [Alphaproteobacteria bacterium]|nr:LemA family protein [Alphaproteobacteria bacterium]